MTLLLRHDIMMTMINIDWCLETMPDEDEGKGDQSIDRGGNQML